MNERIRELAEHCDFYVGNEHSGKSHEEKQWLWLEKFTELIVADMISIIEPTEEHRRDASWGYLGGNEGVELLDGLIASTKKHFGV